MFTGIVQGTAAVAELDSKDNFKSFKIDFPPGKANGVQIGASVAINGTCLTVTAIDGDVLSFDVMMETLRATSLGALQVGSKVNFERSARVGDEIGGHNVSGHVHCTAKILKIEDSENNRRVTFQLPEKKWMKYILPKGFIAVDGCSLTVGEVRDDNCFSVYLIPETLRVTVFGIKGEGDEVNIEIEAQTQAIGGEVQAVYSTDGELIMRQEAYFHYLFGVNEDGFWGGLDVRNGKTFLFMPKLPEAYGVWMGPIQGPDYYKAKYCVDEVAYLADLAAVLAAAAPPCIHVLAGSNSDSGTEIKPLSFPGSESLTIETATLFPTLNESRVHKTPGEIVLMKYVNHLGSRAHVAMMQAAKPGMMEYQLESIFRHFTYTRGGCRHQVLFDMGCEYYRYGSDITCSWPVDGKFTEQQKLVYNAVLAAHSGVIAAIAPGVSWPKLHTLAYEKILGGLAAGGLLQGDLQELIEAEVGGLFMPHGLGHLIGIDTHDVGGYGLDFPERIQRPGFKSLRTARVLEEGMIITVEPGCYFNPVLLDPHYSKYLVKDELLPFMSMGGVRLEDNVVVTATGSLSLTDVPRTVEEVETVMAGKPWAFDGVQGVSVDDVKNSIKGVPPAPGVTIV
eukprot:gene6059-6297_t